MTKKQLPQVPSLKTKPSRFGRGGAATSQSNGSCVGVLSNLLNCWASYAEGAAQCVALEQAVKDCMTNRVHGRKRTDSMGRDSARLLPKINPKAHD